MAKDLSFEAYQPQPFCKFDCKFMSLELQVSSWYAGPSQQIVERLVSVECKYEAVCKAARRQLEEEVGLM